MNSTLSEKKTD